MAGGTMRLMLCLLLLAMMQLAQAQPSEVRIGVLSFRPLAQTQQQWQPTADYLNAAIPGYHFSIETAFFPELDRAIDQHRFDFILTNPEHYVSTRSAHGLAAIATLISLADGHPVSSFGGVILTRADRDDINTLQDIRGKVVASAAEQSFGAYLIQRWAMFKQGIQIGEVGKLRFTGMPQDKAVQELLAGKADVAFVRTGIVESMAREGSLNLHDVKVLNQQPSERFPQVLSTDLYPEWAFSAAADVPGQLVKKVSLALLNIQPEDAAAKTGKYYGFTPPGNYAPVEAVMLRLKMNPDYAREFDWRDVVIKYAMPIVGVALLLMLGFLAVALHLMSTNRRLRHSYFERERLDEKLQQANVTLEEKVAQRTQQLQESEQRFRSILQSSPIAVRIADQGGHRVAFANHSYEGLIGAAEGQAVGVDPQSYYARPQDYAEVLQRLATGEQIKDRLVELNMSERGMRWALASYVTFRFEGEDAVLGWFYDITPLKQIEQALLQSEARFRHMFEHHASPMLLLDPGTGNIVNANQAAAKFYGYSIEQMTRMTIYQINALTAEEINSQRQQEAQNYFVFPHRLADGKIRTVEVHSSPLEVDGRALLFSIIHDITERKELEEQMHDLAFYDPLTKLPNRRLLLDRLGKSLVSAARTRSHGALMFLDLDHFKTLNDLHGHDVGDMLLVEVANRLLGCIREQDSVARLGGDEFVVLLDGLSEKSSDAVVRAELVAEKVRAALAQPYVLKRTGDEEPIIHHCSSSIGVTVFCEHDETLEQLIKWTDMAMYRAKEAGRNTIRFFDPAMQTAVEQRAALEADLHVALVQGQFRLFYQIQVNSGGKPIGAEALLRWQHPQRGLVSPAEFIPLAEESGLIVPIGAWVLDDACAQIKCWQQDKAMKNLSFAINVSARQFQQANFVEEVMAAVRKHSIPPLSLKIELTESTVLVNVEETISKMDALKEIGVLFSMDDFGTGYSSLSYLKRLPLDQLKIDQSFVRGITNDAADSVMVMTLVDLGMNFELDVIAEGVETEAQLKVLRRCGCGNYQGFLFSKPVPVAQFEQLVHERLLK